MLPLRTSTARVCRCASSQLTVPSLWYGSSNVRSARGTTRVVCSSPPSVLYPPPNAPPRGKAVHKIRHQVFSVLPLVTS